VTLIIYNKTWRLPRHSSPLHLSSTTRLIYKRDQGITVISFLTHKLPLLLLLPPPPPPQLHLSFWHRHRFRSLLSWF